MKNSKIIKIILIAIIFLIIILSIVLVIRLKTGETSNGFNLFSKTSDSTTNNIESNNTSLEYLQESIIDKENAYELIINYPNKEGISISNGTDSKNKSIKVLKNVTENLKIQIAGYKQTSSVLESQKEEKEKTDNYKEITFGKFEGYEYGDSDYAIIIAKLEEISDDNIIYLQINLSRIDSSIETDMLAALKSDFVKDIEKNLEFKVLENYQVDGTLSPDNKFYLKTIDDDNILEKYDLTVTQENSLNSILAVLNQKNGNSDSKSTSDISVQITASSSDEFKKSIRSLGGSRTYEETELFGYNAYSNESNNENSVYRYYFIQKHGIIYYIRFYVSIDSGNSVETGEEFLKDVINNIEEFSEE